MNTKEQMEYIDFGINPRAGQDNLCGYMTACPDTSLIECTKCIGSIPTDALRAIKSPLHKGNLEEAINVWEILIK